MKRHPNPRLQKRRSTALHNHWPRTHDWRVVDDIDHRLLAGRLSATGTLAGQEEAQAAARTVTSSSGAI